MSCERKYTCDRCRVVIPAGERTAVEVASGADRHAGTLDLCRRCYEQFRAWLAAAAGDDAA